MNIEFVKNALDRVSLSLIIDDSAPLVNVNYFWLKQRFIHTEKHQRWEDVPVVTPMAFTREFAKWCTENGVKGKFSVIPVPAGLGRIDKEFPLFGKKQMDEWLDMCKKEITPIFDITPEMLSHTYVLDLNTFKPREDMIWEQYEWQALPDYESAAKYITQACSILTNVGLKPEGVTSPGAMGMKTKDIYSKAVAEALYLTTNNKTPYFFGGVETRNSNISLNVWNANKENASAVTEITVCTDDRTGSWTGYGIVDEDYYIGEDLMTGRLPEVIDAKSPCILCSHWQGFYGMHNEDRKGFEAFKKVVDRLKQRDPYREKTVWRKVSEISDYTIALALADIESSGNDVIVDLPFIVPEITMKTDYTDIDKIWVDSKPLKRVFSKRDFRTNTFFVDSGELFLAFDPVNKRTKIEFSHGDEKWNV